MLNLKIFTKRFCVCMFFNQFSNACVYNDQRHQQNIKLTALNNTVCGKTTLLFIKWIHRGNWCNKNKTYDWQVSVFLLECVEVCWQIASFRWQSSLLGAPGKSMDKILQIWLIFSKSSSVCTNRSPFTPWGKLYRTGITNEYLLRKVFRNKFQHTNYTLQSINNS